MMNEINLRVSPEQFATLQKLLEPYVLLSTQLNAQYRAQVSVPVKAEKLNPGNSSDLEEIIIRG